LAHPSSPSVLRADGISHSYGDRAVLVDLSLTVSAGQRVGLLGENGAGKSTLLRLLAGVEHADRGVVTRPQRLGLLAQEVAAAPDAPLSAIIDAAIAPLRALERELQSAAEALGGPEADAEQRYELALASAEAAELWSLDARRDELLRGLGVAELALDRPVASVSGGQRSRVALAALLLARPDALLLDEPTNHLDDRAVDFLGGVLRGWRGAILFASHDRAFLDDVATELLDIDPSRDDGCDARDRSDALRRRVHRLPRREGGRAGPLGGAVRRRGARTRAARGVAGRHRASGRPQSGGPGQRQVPARLQEEPGADTDRPARAQCAGPPRRAGGRPRA